MNEDVRRDVMLVITGFKKFTGRTKMGPSVLSFSLSPRLDGFLPFSEVCELLLTSTKISGYLGAVSIPENFGAVFCLEVEVSILVRGTASAVRLVGFLSM